MNKYKIYLVAIACLGIGFAASWLLSTSKYGEVGDSTDQSNTKGVTTQAQPQIWTCSMHPQIRQDEPGDCPICGMDLIPANQANSESEFGLQMTEEAIQLANIQTTIVGNSSAEGSNSLKLNGKIQADETQAASIVTHIPGRIEKLFVSYTGEQVDKGQKIASIYSPQLITAQKELLEAKKIQDISPGLLAAAKNKLKYWKISNQLIEEILRNGSIQETFTIYADHAGVVAQKRVSVGDYLSTGEVLFDVQNLNRLWALFDVYEKDLPHVKVGSSINFSTPSAPNKTFKAKITFVNPVIDPSTRAAAVRAEVSNQAGNLKPEMFITGLLSTYKKSGTLSVPKSAVLWTGRQSVVYVKIPAMDIPSFEFREIELGEATALGYSVMNGLEHGEEVVTNGAFVIDASAQLNNEASMMNKQVMAKNTVHAEHLPDYTNESPESFKRQLSDLANTYFPLKDALVSSDSKQATAAGNELTAALEKVEMSLLKGAGHMYWMEQSKAIQVHGKKITETEDLEEQRNQFDFLSQALIKAIKVFGIHNDTFYVQHCPMANDNEGADWLSKHHEILNPYFGDKMLTCGIVQDTIDKHFKNASMQEPGHEKSKTQQNSHKH